MEVHRRPIRFCKLSTVTAPGALLNSHRGKLRLALLPLIGFVYVLFRPVSNGNVLLPLLIGLAACGFVVGFFRRHCITPALLLFLGWQLLFGVMFGLVGSGNMGLRDQLQTFVGFPVIFWLIVYGISQVTLARVMWALAIGCTIVGLTIVAYVGNQQGVLPQIIPVSFLKSQTGAVFDSARFGRTTSIQFYGLATLAGGGPLWVASLLVPRARLLPPMWMRLLAAVSCVLAALVAGRQALVVTTILAPALLWGVSSILGRVRADRAALGAAQLFTARKRNAWLVLGMVAGVSIVGNVSFQRSTVSGSTVGNALKALSATYLGSGALSDDLNTRTRQQEGQMLLTGFREHPILGSGLGATVPHYQRDAVSPWHFELQYHMLLFDTGLVGILFALVAGAIFVFAARSAVKRRPDLAGDVVVASVGCVALLMASASNPYLQAPGYNWALYLPIAAINVALTSVPATRGGKGPVEFDEIEPEQALRGGGQISVSRRVAS